MKTALAAPGPLLVARSIRRLLAEGLVVSAATRHHIDSTLLNPTVAQLSAVLADPDHPERDPLLELVFFPDASFQAALEPALETLAPGLPVYAAVRADLLAQPLPVRIVFSRQPPEELKLEMPPSCVPGFLGRLHLEREIDPLLAAACRQHLPEALVSRTRVRLRNVPPPDDPSAIAFFSALFALLLPRVEADLADLAFLLEVAASDLPQGHTMAGALARRKRRLFFSLQHSAGIERCRKRAGLEAMLLQGVRPPALDQGEAHRQMSLIDRVCHAVFGRTEKFVPPAGEESEALQIPAGDLERLIGLLG